MPPVRSAETRTIDHELPPRHLNIMRLGYAFMGLGLAIVKWPIVVQNAPSLPVPEGVVACLLTAMSLLALLGLRYPVRMLPILLFEVLWKVMVGLLATSKKFSPFRSLLCRSFSVLLLAVSAVISHTASEKSSLVAVLLASNFLKYASTSAIRWWVTVKAILKCPLSNNQVWALVAEILSRVAAESRSSFKPI